MANTPANSGIKVQLEAYPAFQGVIVEDFPLERKARVNEEIVDGTTGLTCSTIRNDNVNEVTAKFVVQLTTDLTLFDPGQIVQEVAVGNGGRKWEITDYKRSGKTGGSLKLDVKLQSYDGMTY